MVGLSTLEPYHATPLEDLERHVRDLLLGARRRLSGERDVRHLGIFTNLITAARVLSRQCIEPLEPGNDIVDDELNALRRLSRDSHIGALARLHSKFTTLQTIGHGLARQVSALERHVADHGHDQRSHELARILQADVTRLNRAYSPRIIERAAARLLAHEELSHERLRQSPTSGSRPINSNSGMRRFRQ